MESLVPKKALSPSGPAGAIADVPFRGTMVHVRAWAVSALLLACLVWSYWPTILELCAFWSRNDDYSYGPMVPFIAIYFVLRDRARFGFPRVFPCLWGLVAILVAQAIRFAGAYYDYASVERYSLVCTAVGLVLLVAGWRVVVRVKWVCLFLLLMVPLPRQIHEGTALPLQGLASGLAEFSLQSFGFFVVRNGNVLRINEDSLVAVTEACSGLRMLTAFIMVAAVVAFLVRRPAWHKAVLVFSSIPIAILTNVIRLVATSLFIVYADAPESADLFHDYAGFVMMPVALLFLLGELRLLSRISLGDRGLAVQRRVVRSFDDVGTKAIGHERA